MSDPRPADRGPGTPPPAAEPPPPRSGTGILVWVLLLIAMFAIAWYFLGRRDTVQVPPEVTPPPIGDTAAVPSESPVSAPPAREARERTRPTPADRDARAVNQPAPRYPVAALRAREAGAVVLQVDVGADGSASNVEIVRSSRSRDLDRAALEAVRDWTFEPAIRDGRPVASSVQVPVDFTLDSQ